MKHLEQAFSLSSENGQAGSLFYGSNATIKLLRGYPDAGSSDSN